MTRYCTFYKKKTTNSITCIEQKFIYQKQTQKALTFEDDTSVAKELK